MSRRVDCTTWPCRTCDRAGRSSWRSRQAWHLLPLRVRAVSWLTTWLRGGAR